ncbi:MAG: phage holin family protein [Opitutae bacterium]|nr:phage holin family protein [Opitutae bacterium]
MNNPFVNLLVRWMVLALGVVLSATLVPGIHYDTAGTLAVVVILLSFFNAVLKPLMVLFTLPFIVLSLGIGVWIINAVLFYFVGKLVDGFHVAGFGSALLGAAVVSLTNLILTRMLKSAAVPPTPPPPRGPRRDEKRDDVIDI